MTLFILILAYIIGSIPTALIVGRFFFQIDIREHGSNNPGATNTLRVLGKQAAIACAISRCRKRGTCRFIAYSFSS